MIAISRDVINQLVRLPDNKGVYVLKDNEGKIIFVNTAKSLLKDVRTHFHSNKQSDKIIKLKTRSIEIFEEDDDIKLAKIELDLIKLHHPPLNQRGHDQKRYRFIELTVNEKYPTAIVRKIITDNPEILSLGPYPKKSTIRQVFSFAINFFEIADCRQRIITGRNTKTTASCLRRKTRQCCRPCEIEIDTMIYNKKIDDFIKFFRGEFPNIITDLEKEMNACVNAQEFEKAAILRDNINAIKQHIKFKI